METNPLEETQASKDGLNRRQLMQLGAAALAAGVVLPQQCSDGDRPQPGPGSKRPNIILLMTDQERFPQYWPEGWAETNLPNRQRIAKHGLTFNRAFCNAAMCSASRATLFTGAYAAQHGVKYVLTNCCLGEEGCSDTAQPTLKLPTEQPNLGSMLAAAGYNVQYRGKWHISKAPGGTQDVQSPRDLARYGFHGWVPPESGQDQYAEHFGGGDEDFDGQYAEQAAQFLKHANPNSSKPFALVVSLSNPHDIMGYPNYWDKKSQSDNPAFGDWDNYGSHAPDCFCQNIDLPPQPTLEEDLNNNFKPPAHYQSLTVFNNSLGELSTEEMKRNYVNFYAYLHRLTDEHMGKVLDALESNPGVHENTVVIRCADHGEMGLSHGGLRQKTYNAYEETIHVPLVISNPKMFPHPVQTDALASLIDIFPTVATLAGITGPEKCALSGVDLSPIIHDAVRHRNNPTATVQDSILFTTDELSQYIVGPYHVRCLREERWKFVINFDPQGKHDSFHELYDLANDPMELYNMGCLGSPYYDEAKTNEMLAKLRAKLAEFGIDGA
jgi:arylsulfatase A-like enzyme